MTTNSTNDNAWRKFICLACGYIYNEKFGNPEYALSAGTRFESISNDWQCPLCGVNKSDFELYEDTERLTSAVALDHTKHDVVIIGGGLAGWAMVDALRALDKDIPITLISNDSADRYHKPMLSVATSQNKGRDQLVRITGEQSARDNNIHLLAHTFVTDINPLTQSLDTQHGTIHYDKLILAIGATPAYPPVISEKMAFHINDLDKFTELQSRLNTPKHIAIIGAGMIGMELSEDLVRAGHRISLIDVHPYPLSTLLPAMAGERILHAIESFGVHWLGCSMIKNVQAAAKGHEITLFDCTTQEETSLVVDEIIVATGLIIHEHLPTCANLRFDNQTGIAVHAQTLQTSAPNIYALGDCISIDGIPCRYVAPHRSQAAAIAEQVLQKDGEKTIYKHTPPMIRLKNKCISVTATGLPKGMGDWQVVHDDGNELIIEMNEHGHVVAKATIKSVLKP